MALQDSLNSLRRATYIGKDFDTYVVELTQYIKQQYGDKTFNDFVESDLGIMFLELVAFANSTLSFYLDLQSSESYIETAKLRNSVVRLCRNIGFKMTGAVPATTTLQISMETPKDFDVPIAAGTQLTSTPGFVFETVDSLKFTKNLNLTGTYMLMKRSNVVYAGSNIISPDATAIPEQEIVFDQALTPPFTKILPVSAVKRKTDSDESYRLAISVNTTAPYDGTTLPKEVYVESPFPDDIFPDDDTVFLENDVLNVGNVAITTTCAGVSLVGMGKASASSKAQGMITVPAGSAIADTATLVLDDGVNPAVTFEFDKNSSVTAGRVAITISNSSTTADVANAIMAAINGIGITLGITATEVGAFVTTTGLNPLRSGEVGPKLVNVHEGESVEEIFLSKGTPNQRFALLNVPEDKMIADGTVDVYVNNVPYVEVEFIDYQQSDIFEAQLASIPPNIRFGDGVAGNVPNENAEIRVAYFATSGNSGNIPSDQITDFRAPVVVNFQAVSDFVISQPDTANGGIDYFPLNKAKAYAPHVFKSQDRAVTEEDYTALANSYSDPDAGAVGKAKAVIVRSIEDDFILQNLLNQLLGFKSSVGVTNGNYAVMQASFQNTMNNIRTYWDEVVSGTCKANVVQIGVLSTDAYGRYQAPSAALLQGLTTYLDLKKEATVDVVAFDGVVYTVPLDIKIEIERVTGYTKDNVYTNVNTAILAYIRTLNFGDPLRLGDAYQVTEGVDGVKFSRITIVSPANPGNGVPIPGFEPAYYDETDLVTGKLQIIEARDIQIVFLD